MLNVCISINVLNILSYFTQVFLVRKILGPDAGQLYAMKVLKKASLKGNAAQFLYRHKTPLHRFPSAFCPPHCGKFRSHFLFLFCLSSQGQSSY